MSGTQKSMTPQQWAEKAVDAWHATAGSRTEWQVNDLDHSKLIQSIVATIRAAVQQEREECAALCDEARDESLRLVQQGVDWEIETACAAEARAIARSIRARGDTELPVGAETNGEGENKTR